MKHIAAAIATIAAATASNALAITGNGTADSPYTVSTATQWNELAAYLQDSTASTTDTYIKLTTSIDFDGSSITPLGYGRTAAFDGDLDGGGYAISGFNNTADADYYGAIAIETGTNASIHDLTVTGTLTSGYAYTAGVAGKLAGQMARVTGNVAIISTGNYTAGLVAYASEGCTLDSCVNQGDITSTGTYTAGVVSLNLAGVTYNSCANTGAITYNGSTNYSYTAGVVSCAYGCTLTGCSNSGNILVSDSTRGLAAGIMAYPYSTSSSVQSFTLTGCANFADVTAGYAVAGIMSNNTSNSYSKVTMDGCYNTGDITAKYAATKSNCYTAGVAAVYFHNSTYTGCWNSGTITSAAPYAVAGVLGNSKGGSETECAYITGCYNTGDVVSDVQYAAGIAGYVGGYTYIDSCYNTGNITGSKYTGGIVGRLALSTASITRCFNAGDVTVSVNYAGGIVGQSNFRALISQCFNVGNVATTCTIQGAAEATSGFAVGGIGGIAGAEIVDVYNAGTITGVSRVGGIVGSATKSSTSYTTVTNAYSTGIIDAPSDTCGNIVGSSVFNDQVWTDSSAIMNAYFLTANDAVSPKLTRDTSSVGLTYAELGALDLGESWTAGDDYTYPRLTAFADNDYALAHAAAVIPAEGDSYSSITQDFFVGTPDGVTWSTDNPDVTIDGNNVAFGQSFTGTLTMTATAGTVKVATSLACDVEVAGIDAVAAVAPEVVATAYYTASGVRVSEPTGASPAVYIVVRTHADGSTTAAKVVR